MTQLPDLHDPHHGGFPAAAWVTSFLSAHPTVGDTHLHLHYHAAPTPVQVHPTPPMVMVGDTTPHHINVLPVPPTAPTRRRVWVLILTGLAVVSAAALTAWLAREALDALATVIAHTIGGEF
jgi:hypothetical protein